VLKQRRIQTFSGGKIADPCFHKGEGEREAEGKGREEEGLEEKGREK